MRPVALEELPSEVLKLAEGAEFAGAPALEVETLAAPETSASAAERYEYMVTPGAVRP